MKKNTIKIIASVVIFAVVVIAIAAFLGAFSDKSKVINVTEFNELLEKGEITSVYISGSYNARILLKGSKIDEKQFPRKYDKVLNIAHRTTFEEYVLDYNQRVAMANAEHEGEEGWVPLKTVKLSFDDPSDGSLLTSLLPIFLALILFVVFFILISRSNANANNKAINFGNSRANLVRNSKVRFTDVAGAEEEKEELKEIVEFLSNPAKFQAVGAKTPHGVLLVGNPGTGKTLFAKAVAGEAGVPFFSITGSDFVEMFVGVGASRVRDLFTQAKKVMPCIVFIDEIDAVGRQRGAGLGGGNDEREQTLNQLLVEMDGFESNDGIIVMAATNRADVLDPALLRPGRFDRQIYVSSPDVKGREEILKVHARNKPLSGDIDFSTIARMTIGFTGADLANLLNEAAILAARANRKVITNDDIMEGINKVIMGPQKKSRVITAADKRITAYHESGHAIIAKVLPNCDDVQEVSIIPRGQAAGYTLTRPTDDSNHMTKNELLDTITMMLGGRAAEEIVIKDVATGASNDIQRATGLARKMVTEWGMSNLGTVYLGSDQEVFVGRSFGSHSDISNDMANKIDAEIKRIIDECYARAIETLNANREIMEKMVDLLFDKETIYKNEVDALFV